MVDELKLAPVLMQHETRAVWDWKVADYLLTQGHNGPAHCEKCWREAATLYANGQGAYESHTEAYFAVMERAVTAASAQLAAVVREEVKND